MTSPAELHRWRVTLFGPDIAARIAAHGPREAIETMLYTNREAISAAAGQLPRREYGGLAPDELHELFGMLEEARRAAGIFNNHAREPLQRPRPPLPAKIIHLADQLRRRHRAA